MMEKFSEHEIHWMKAAVEKTREGIYSGQSPFGACIVMDNQLISCEHNIVLSSCDITAHAEITAIREACRKLNTIDLSGCVIFSTCEPCPMCFTAIHWARIGRIYYGASIEDAADHGFNELKISNFTLRDLGRSGINIIPGLMKKQCVELFEQWSKLPYRKTY